MKDEHLLTWRCFGLELAFDVCVSQVPLCSQISLS